MIKTYKNKIKVKILEVRPDTLDEGNENGIQDAYVKVRANGKEFWCFVPDWRSYFPYHPRRGVKAGRWGLGKELIKNVTGKEFEVEFYLSHYPLDTKRADKKEKIILQKKGTKQVYSGEIIEKKSNVIIVDCGIIIRINLDRDEDENFGFKVGDYIEAKGNLYIYLLNVNEAMSKRVKNDNQNLKNVFPDISLFSEISDYSLGVAPMLLNVHEIKGLKSMSFLSRAEQSSIGKFFSKTGDSASIEARVAFLNGLDETAVKRFAGMPSEKVSDVLFRTLDKEEPLVIAAVLENAEKVKSVKGFERLGLQRGDATGIISQIKHGESLMKQGHEIEFERPSIRGTTDRSIDIYDYDAKTIIEVKRATVIIEDVNKIKKRVAEGAAQCKYAIENGVEGKGEIIIDLSRGTVLTDETIKNGIVKWFAESTNAKYVDTVKIIIPGKEDIVIPRVVR